jgi:hypothetical protein
MTKSWIEDAKELAAENVAGQSPKEVAADADRELGVQIERFKIAWFNRVAAAEAVAVKLQKAMDEALAELQWLRARHPQDPRTWTEWKAGAKWDMRHPNIIELGAKTATENVSEAPVHARVSSLESRMTDLENRVNRDFLEVFRRLNAVEKKTE